MRRYNRSTVLASGRQYGTSRAAILLRAAIDEGSVSVDIRTLRRGERLDTIAGDLYGDARLWWVIAAASGIGWGLQAPPGTRLSIPRDLSEVAEVVG